MTRVLITGATTLLGAEVLRELISRHETSAVLLLMPIDETARLRDLDRLRAYLGSLPSSVTLVAGDVRLARFGLSLAAWDDLAASFDISFHCAQRETKDQNLELARQTNVQAADGWVDLLVHNPNLRLHHVSTALVGGTRRGLFTEFDVQCNQGFHDAWEQSNFEAELRLRESPIADRVNIYRPSHILGRATTGEAFQMGGGYPLVATLAAASFLPGDANARIDFVPADYVASSMVALALSGASGTFHLACGWQDSVAVKQIAALAAKGLGRSQGARLLPPPFAWPLGITGVANPGKLASRYRAFTAARDLLRQGPVFDTYLADLALAPLGVTRRAPECWIEMMVNRADARNWEASGPAWTPKPASTFTVATTPKALAHKNASNCEKHFHQVRDVKVAYREVGEGEPVVFLHGFDGAIAWDDVVELVSVRRRAIVVGTLGLSNTEAPSSSDFGLPAQAAIVRGLLSALDVPNAHIVGSGIGGIIAQMFAVRWPQCTKSLVLSDCDTHGKWPSSRLALVAALTNFSAATRATAALLRMPAVARSRFGFGCMLNDKRPLTAERVARHLDAVAGTRERRLRLKLFLRTLSRANFVSLNRQLGQLHMPTMIIWGGDNARQSASWAKTLYDAIPGAHRLELIPFAGSFCHEERPEVFGSLLSEFWNEIGSGIDRRGQLA